ncbi:MAG TPA: multidrug transporter subunit MdtA, partial [Paraburkholderia sp.]
MDEQQQHSETSRPAAPAPSRSPSGPQGDPPDSRNTPPGAVRSHRGRNIALIVLALVILGFVLWRWHPWGAPGG